MCLCRVLVMATAKAPHGRVALADRLRRHGPGRNWVPFLLSMAVLLSDEVATTWR